MPKHDFLTPKAISNRIKAKGLQKLRWYCQMCQKQCRDENGFKCHVTSESHQRQLLLVAENPYKYTDQFSREFLANFLDILRKQYGTRRVLANTVYQSYIADRNHLHMNSTRWMTLGSLCKWLGREGICKVDETSRGWNIAYVDRDPATIERQSRLKKKEKLETDDEEKTAKFIEQQVARAAINPPSDPGYTELLREEEDGKIQFSMDTKMLSTQSQPQLPTLPNPLQSADKIKDTPKPSRSRDREPSETRSISKRPKISALDEIKSIEEKRRENKNRFDHWLHKGIVVKINTKLLGENYFKKKGVVVDLEDKFIALVKMIDSGDVLKMDQIYLETVIPNIGRDVLIVNGANRGSNGKIMRVCPESFSVDVEMLDGVLIGTVVKQLEYEDVCKLHKE
ncbi:DNA/RNA-binding protein KIN17 [Oopsacas minuta]|uniref:DNA/RNA-binding protein KIN17 n=1 Tax=Oopsacas minuta TaxID=111878 RepID=A0AAV7KI81_9METZ|nr:DNA/RNA-binding protein KIN17 [Oopsacas minuta]